MSPQGTDVGLYCEAKNTRGLGPGQATEHHLTSDCSSPRRLGWSLAALAVSY